MCVLSSNWLVILINILHWYENVVIYSQSELILSTIEVHFWASERMVSLIHSSLPLPHEFCIDWQSISRTDRICRTILWMSCCWIIPWNLIRTGIICTVTCYETLITPYLWYASNNGKIKWIIKRTPNVLPNDRDVIKRQLLVLWF